MIGVEREEKVSRASAGDIRFADGIDEAMRTTIREMWVNRLSGYGARDLDRYLRDNSESTRYVIGGTRLRASTFRRICRLLFAIQRCGSVLDLTLSAEALDAHVTREGKRFVTRGHLVLTAAGRILRQSRLTMSITHESGRWVWDEVVEVRVPRSGWRYAGRRGPHGDLRFRRAESAAAQF